MSIILSLLISQGLSPLGLDWWITLGGWVPGFAAVAIAFVIWIRSTRSSDKDE
jgi:hypothetical protein